MPQRRATFEERLEIALRNQKLPAELADAALMRFMHWSWPDLMAAPVQLVEDIRTWIEKDAAIAREREALAGAEHRRRGGG